MWIHENLKKSQVSINFSSRFWINTIEEGVLPRNPNKCLFPNFPIFAQICRAEFEKIWNKIGKMAKWPWKRSKVIENYWFFYKEFNNFASCAGFRPRILYKSCKYVVIIAHILARKLIEFSKDFWNNGKFSIKIIKYFKFWAVPQDHCFSFLGLYKLTNFPECLTRIAKHQFSIKNYLWRYQKFVLKFKIPIDF